jgi:hypothetical protein
MVLLETLAAILGGDSNLVEAILIAIARNVASAEYQAVFSSEQRRVIIEPFLT